MPTSRNPSATPSAATDERKCAVVRPSRKAPSFFSTVTAEMPTPITSRVSQISMWVRRKAPKIGVYGLVSVQLTRKRIAPRTTLERMPAIWAHRPSSSSRRPHFSALNPMARVSCDHSPVRAAAVGALAAIVEPRLRAIRGPAKERERRRSLSEVLKIVRENDGDDSALPPCLETKDRFVHPKKRNLGCAKRGPKPAADRNRNLIQGTRLRFAVVRRSTRGSWRRTSHSSRTTVG